MIDVSSFRPPGMPAMMRPHMSTPPCISLVGSQFFGGMGLSPAGDRVAADVGANTDEDEPEAVLSPSSGGMIDSQEEPTQKSQSSSSSGGIDNAANALLKKVNVKVSKRMQKRIFWSQRAKISPPPRVKPPRGEVKKKPAAKPIKKHTQKKSVNEASTRSLSAEVPTARDLRTWADYSAKVVASRTKKYHGWYGGYKDGYGSRSW